VENFLFARPARTLRVLVRIISDKNSVTAKIAGISEVRQENALEYAATAN
jgi:hypothetical protein